MEKKNQNNLVHRWHYLEKFQLIFKIWLFWFYFKPEKILLDFINEIVFRCFFPPLFFLLKHPFLHLFLAPKRANALFGDLQRVNLGVFRVSTPQFPYQQAFLFISISSAFIKITQFSNNFTYVWLFLTIHPPKTIRFDFVMLILFPESFFSFIYRSFSYFGHQLVIHFRESIFSLPIYPLSWIMSFFNSIFNFFFVFKCHFLCLIPSILSNNLNMRTRRVHSTISRHFKCKIKDYKIKVSINNKPHNIYPS